jgi:DNA-directed RNA polymerase specialized sigma24 family protein
MAGFILLEHLRRPKTAQLNPDVAAAGPEDNDEPVRVRCCKQCLSRLPAQDRELVCDYYLGGKKGEAKIIRFEVAGELGIRQGALRIKVFRLKQKLFQCMRSCLETGGAEA